MNKRVKLLQAASAAAHAEESALLAAKKAAEANTCAARAAAVSAAQSYNLVRDTCILSLTFSSGGIKTERLAKIFS